MHTKKTSLQPNTGSHAEQCCHALRASLFIRLWWMCLVSSSPQECWNDLFAINKLRVIIHPLKVLFLISRQVFFLLTPCGRSGNNRYWMLLSLKKKANFLTKIGHQKDSWSGDYLKPPAFKNEKKRKRHSVSGRSSIMLPQYVPGQTSEHMKHSSFGSFKYYTVWIFWAFTL